MVARNRPPDIQDTFRLYLDARQRLTELGSQAAELRRAGKIRAAKKIEAAAEDIRAQLAAVEREMKPVGPGD